jgi:cytochrome oxidase Cu insertion factor (SCO1/SenC/PrrC family)
MKKLAVLLPFLLMSVWACENATSSYDYTKLENASVLNQELNISLAGIKFTTTSKESEKVFSKDKINLVFFGFPGCHGVCPTTMASLSDELKALPINKREKYKVVFVNVDKSATRDQVNEFLSTYGEGYLGVLPSDGEELKKLSKLFGAFSREPRKGEVTSEKIIHSSQVFVVSPEKKWVGYYKFPLLKGKVASDFSRVLL